MNYKMNIFVLTFALLFSGSTGAAQYDFNEALDHHGAVDLNFNPWADVPIETTVEALRTLDVGVVNRVGFFYGGVSTKFLQSLQRATTLIHASLPKAIIGGGFNEALYSNYKATLPCVTSEAKEETFSAEQLVGAGKLAPDQPLVDLGLKSAQDYYICIGMLQIDMGISLLHFEAPGEVLNAASDRSLAISGYKTVMQALAKYAGSKGQTVYFSGDPTLAAAVSLDAIYTPARFFHTTVKSVLRYQNKIARPGRGVGYTYALSHAIARDTLSQVPSHTKVLFYVDNWDESQDDLRRYMELDPANRRELLVLSGQAAKEEGVYFLPPVIGCVGCVKITHVGDSCELRGDAAKQVSEYSAPICHDLDAIKASLAAQIR